ncbi:hypothetical protein EP47_09575 [Legionella norrlandica]|uniref:Uncharacterized protein n=1 Tax=Legionella norrlandica TaxID=1498499 RepID=A0A0A2SVL7_9GAMM|nr:hypothetical protein [Legionella norrlandica]KGP63449.1 hypothetical protein EP47_09575 [Legionella norrlandica]
MISISSLGSHPSSPLKFFNNEKELAKRDDLYTGEDFYFGFDSSNHSFLDIIGGKKPLAIKYGQILSLYKQSIEGNSCVIYCINANEKKLVPIITINTLPADAHLLQQLLPWSFTDFYSERCPVDEWIRSTKRRATHSEYRIQKIIEQISNSQWPNDSELDEFNRNISDLLAKNSDLRITVHDLSPVKAQANPEILPSNHRDLITPYSPFHNNARLSVDFFKTKFPHHITVRLIDDVYSRIEIITPGIEDDLTYKAIYKSTSPVLYWQLKEVLNNPEELTVLLQEEFKDLVDEFLLKQYPERPKQPDSGLICFR